MATNPGQQSQALSEVQLLTTGLEVERRLVDRRKGLATSAWDSVARHVVGPVVEGRARVQVDVRHALTGESAVGKITAALLIALL